MNIKDLLNDKNVIMLCEFGSHLYGTDSEKSDRDYKGIYIPTMEEYLMGKVKKTIVFSSGDKDSRNNEDDVDIELFSLNYFVELACGGQTAQFDMLFCTEDHLMKTSYIWDEIVKNRELFFSKSMKAFVGYCSKQAYRYGIKGTRIAAIKDVIELMNAHTHFGKFGDFWEDLPVGEQSKFEKDKKGEDIYSVCGKSFQKTAPVSMVLGSLTSFVGKYGERAKEAESNDGIDWKALSHALRAGHQLAELYTTRHITFPLPNADYIKKVKYGGLDFKTVVQPDLELIVEEVMELAEKSTFPETVDKDYWRDFVLTELKNFYEVK